MDNPEAIETVAFEHGYVLGADEGMIFFFMPASHRRLPSADLVDLVYSNYESLKAYLLNQQKRAEERR